MYYQNLILNIKNNIAVLTVNRPDKLNALNRNTLDELKRVLLELKDNKEVYVLIITGAGKKSFIAGADISELSKCNFDSGKEFSKKGQKIFDLIENLGKPVIAAINGFALGGGCELALACHIRIASENASFGQPEVNLGIIPGYGGTQRLARLINAGRAAEYILTGDIFNAKEALRLGLISKVFTQEELLSEAEKIAEKISKKGQTAIRSALKSITSINDFTQTEGLNLEAELFAKCCSTEDFIEGTSAFLEKRKPDFKNK